MSDRQSRQSGLESEEFDMTTDINEGNRMQLQEEANEDILPRRQILRTALAVSASLLLPITLFGCDSKKGATPSGTAPASSPAPSTDSAVPAATVKATQVSVQYQTQPKGEQKCGSCVNFIAESNTCKLVDGEISPEGWCLLWTKKA